MLLESLVFSNIPKVATVYSSKNQKIMIIKLLDITKEHCPMTFVKTKIELSKLQIGDRLEVLLTEGEPLENVPRSATEQGFKVLEVIHVKDNIHKITIEK